MRPLIWVSKSMDKLAETLTAMGHPICADTVRKELVKLGFSRQHNRKADEGSKHPDRNAQFEHINTKVVAAQAAGQPVISVDTKKKELVGNYKNGGSDYQPRAIRSVSTCTISLTRSWARLCPTASTTWRPTPDLSVSGLRATRLSSPSRRSAAGSDGWAPTLSESARADDHSGLRRLERRARAALEG